MIFSLRSKRSKKPSSLPLDRRTQFQQSNSDPDSWSSRTDGTWSSTCSTDQSPLTVNKNKQTHRLEDSASVETASTVESMCPQISTGIHQGKESSESSVSTKSVRFASELVSDSFADPQRDNCPRQPLLWHETWYTPQEFKGFKQSLKRQIVRLLHDPKRKKSAALLEDLYHAAYAVTKDVDKGDGDTLEPHARAKLLQIFNQGDVEDDIWELAGLEIFAVQSIFADMKSRREFLQDCRCEVYAQSIATSSNPTTPPEVVEDQLFRVSRTVTRVARLFGQYLAQARMIEPDCCSTSDKE